MIDRQMDGLMVIGPRMMTQEVMQIADRIPTVLIAHHTAAAVNFDTVGIDPGERGAVSLGDQRPLSGGQGQCVDIVYHDMFDLV